MGGDEDEGGEFSGFSSSEDSEEDGGSDVDDVEGDEKVRDMAVV